MKTLKEYNEEFRKRWQESERRKYMTDIACPYCETVEMKYSAPDIILCSFPPQKDIFCPACNYKTSIPV